MNAPDTVAIIRNAKLSATAYRAAHEILYAAQGQESITIDTMTVAGLCHVETWPAARKILATLRAAGILGYSWCGEVTIQFGSSAPRQDGSQDTIQNGSERSKTDHTIQNGSQSGAVIQNGSGPATPMIQNGSPIRGNLVGGLPIPSLPEGSNQPTNQDAPEKPTEPELTDAQRIVCLLMDFAVGVAPAKAKELAKNRAFEFVRRHVGAWWIDVQRGNVKGVGLLIYRIEKGGPPPELSREFRDSDLFRRHRDAADVDEQIYPPLPETPPVAETPAAPPDLSQPWEVVKWEAKTGTIPESLWGPLQDSTLVRGDDVDGVPCYAVILPAGAIRTVIEDRIGTWIRKTLGSLLKQRCLIEFVVAEGT